MTSPQHGGPYYHGSSPSDIESLVSTGINLNRCQRRDRGFFGDGFYVAHRPDTANNYGSEIAEVHTSGADILNAGEMFEGSSIKPTGRPSWHKDFLAWMKGAVADRWMDRWEGTIRPSVTPGAQGFDRQKWYREVADYAEARGYDIVYWTDSEIVIRNPAVVSKIRRIQ